MRVHITTSLGHLLLTFHISLTISSMVFLPLATCRTRCMRKKPSLTENAPVALPYSFSNLCRRQFNGLHTYACARLCVYKEARVCSFFIPCVHVPIYIYQHEAVRMRACTLASISACMHAHLCMHARAQRFEFTQTRSTNIHTHRPLSRVAHERMHSNGSSHMRKVI